MQIVDLAPEHYELFVHCLDPTAVPAQEGAGRRRAWFERRFPDALVVKVAVDDHGQPVGFIQAVPIEHSPAEGERLMFVLCVWVPPSREGRPNARHAGVGTALLHAAEEEAMRRGALGMAAWGIVLPAWMKASWFKKHGYQAVDRLGISSLLFKPFAAEAKPPRWPRRRWSPPVLPGKVSVVAVNSGWCSASNCTASRAERACRMVSGPIDFQEIDTSVDETRQRLGFADGLFVDGKEVRTGPPPSFEGIRRRIQRRSSRRGAPMAP